MNAGVPSTQIKEGEMGRIVGVDGRYMGCLRKFYGMYETLDLDGVTGCGTIDTTGDGPSYMKAVTFQKRGTSTVYRGFVVRWDSQNDNTDEQIDLVYTANDGSSWTRLAIWAAGASNGITSALEIDCAVDRGYLYIYVDTKSPKTVYWTGSALTVVDSGPSSFASELNALTDPDTKAVDSSYNLSGNGIYKVAWRLYDSTRGIYSALSADLVVLMDVMKTTKATGTVIFNSGGGDGGIMVAGDIITINGRTYEYVDSGSAVTIASVGSPGTTAEHCQALADAINGDSSATVSAKAGTSTVLLEALVRGSAGNDYNLAEAEAGSNTTDIFVSDSTLTGGGVSSVDAERQCKAMLDFPNTILSGQSYAAFAALFDTVDVFRTIDLGDAFVAGQEGAVYHLEQTISVPGTEAGWNSLQVTIGTKPDASLPFQITYDPEKDVVVAPPQSGSIGRYQRITFTGQVASTDGGLDTLHSSLEHTSGEYFTTYNKRVGDVEEGRPLRYITAGDAMFILEPNAVIHVYKTTDLRPLQYTVLHRNRGLVGKGAAHAVGNTVFMISGTDLVTLNAVNGSMGVVSTVRRILAGDWRSTLSTIESAYDSYMGASFFLNPSRSEMIVLWHTTRQITMLEGANFVTCSQTVDVEGDGKTRAYFITDTGLIVRPDFTRAGTGTMWGLATGTTLDGTTTTASSAGTHCLDSGATFHADMVGCLLYWTSGDNAGEAVEISGEASGDLTTAAASNAVAIGDRYSISPVPFKVKAWPLQMEPSFVSEGVNPFKRWILKGVQLSVGSLSGFTSNDNSYWRVGAYRNGGSTIETATTEVDVDANPSDSAGSFVVDGISVEPYLEQISCGTNFELEMAEMSVVVGDSRNVTA